MPKAYPTLLALLLLTGCARSPARVPPVAAPTAFPAAFPAASSPTYVTAPAAEAIPQLIAAEREAARRGDLALLAQLWAHDGRIVDTRSSDDPADDFVWPGRDAIMDRYKLAVFPAPPPALDALPAPAISDQGEEVQAVNGRDEWRFANSGGRWWIVELRY